MLLRLVSLTCSLSQSEWYWQCQPGSGGSNPTPSSTGGGTPQPTGGNGNGGSGLNGKFTARGKIYYGTEIDHYHLTNTPLTDIVKKDFGQVTCENSMKWDALEREYLPSYPQVFPRCVNIED
jgi:endo-1,4-beta-xylanase